MTEKILFSAKQVNGKHGFRLQNINFELPEGYIMGVIGKNGAGKTTFFDYIMNQKKRYSGEFLLDGREIHEDHLRTRNQIGFVSERNEFLRVRSAETNAELLGRFYSDFSWEAWCEATEMTGVSRSKSIDRMSRGELMKFQLAFAIAHKPRLLLLDEATAGMDPVFRIDFYKILRTLLETQRCSVILSTHLEEEMEKQLDYVGLLENGKWISFGENVF